MAAEERWADEEAQHTPEVALQRIRECNGRTLDLGGCSLTEVPAEVFELHNLKSLTLSNNNITSIPEDIGT